MVVPPDHYSNYSPTYPLNDPILNGTSNGFDGGLISFNLTIWLAISAFTAVAWYNVAELNVSVFMTFKRRRGLYFWSLIVSSWGVLLHSLGFVLKFFNVITSDPLSNTIITLGWWSMVTGQSLVLYSRLHLVVKERRIERGVLLMIVWNAITLHIPTTVLTYGSKWNAHFRDGFTYMEKIQMTLFCLQEFIISGVYLWATVRLLRPVYRRRTRSVMMQLIWINVLIIGMDLVLLGFEYADQYEVEATLKPMVYSIKLKLEFAVLNQLMRLANSASNPTNFSLHDHSGERPESPRRSNQPLAYIKRVLNGHHESPEETSSTLHPTINDMSSPTIDTNHFPRSMSNATGLSASGFSNTTTKNGKTNGLGVWVPDLDRHAALSGAQLEIAASEARGRASSVSTLYNNPAAFVAPSRPRFRDPLDPLSTINSTLTSPLDEQEEHNYFHHDSSRRDSESGSISPTTREPPALAPAPATTPAPTAASGLQRTKTFPTLSPKKTGAALELPDPELLRPTRPSVSDWKDWSESESERGLSAHELAANRLFNRSKLKEANRVAKERVKEWDVRNERNTEIQMGRGGEGKGMGMDFMTSAL